MELKVALGLAQLFSLIVFATIAVWYVAPWLKRLNRAQALEVLLWPHVFRYVALQAYSARQVGSPISDAALHQIVYGDVAGMIVAFAAIVALRHRARTGIALAWVLVIATAVDMVLNISDGIRENRFGTASGVTWIVVAYYVPLLVVTLGLIVWQLHARRGEPLQAELPVGKPRLAPHASLAS